MKHELPKMLKIERVIREAEGVHTLFLPYAGEVKAGQFVMLWVPGVDAKPAGISYHQDGCIGVTISAVGAWSKEVCGKKSGDLLGLLGPYGNSFELIGENVVLVGGGYGAATLMLLAEEACRRSLKTTLILGARSEAALLYRTRIKAMKLDAIFTTDDGSFGEKGFVTDILQRKLQSEKVDGVYVCGPEIMEKRCAEICLAAEVPSQISLERHMKCGFGVCGACCIDHSGRRVCVEGTIFSGADLLQTHEFGRYRRDSSATKQPFA
ncbi:MAG: dihydroorotate dehydrogenase electron transfer subunit [Deltaproteobacteria bacterium]|nr:dihydroorotate dehydrogenase electron transfer subunit [Deltaproteobacteria bacterium]